MCPGSGTGMRYRGPLLIMCFVVKRGNKPTSEVARAVGTKAGF